MSLTLPELTHPFPRYGLATALIESAERVSLDELDEKTLASVLAEAIENGLNSFRLQTANDPTLEDKLIFHYIRADVLRRNPKLVQGNLAPQGKYLAPTIVTIDKKGVADTFSRTNKILDALKSGKGLFGKRNEDLSRSIAPTTAKINNSRVSQQPPQGTLFEAACSAIATLTPTKPAAWIFIKEENGKKVFQNTVIVPDLPFNELCDFVELFRAMKTSRLGVDLYEAKLEKKEVEGGNRKRSKKPKKDGVESKVKGEYKRPRLFDGNYPFAPRHSAFGAVGIIAAIGKWAVAAGETAWAERVLMSIADTNNKPSCPLYIINYAGAKQVQFTHHVVKLALAGELSKIIDGLIAGTRILSELDNLRSYDSTAYKLFYIMASRFLQQFSLPAFRDFFATRAEYSPHTKGLFEVYFMYARKIDKRIVESARTLGQWLNRTAFFVADAEVKPEAADRHAKVRKEKAKILVEFESAAMSAKTPQDMLHRISTRAGRLLQSDMPAEAKDFIVATASGEGIEDPTDALHLLVTFMRLRSEKTEKLESDGQSAYAQK